MQDDGIHSIFKTVRRWRNYVYRGRYGGLSGPSGD